jgi:putative NADH-flavin reductase
MKIALIGATGLVGSAVLEELTVRHHTITAISRHADKVPEGENVTAHSLDVRDTELLAALLEGQDAVISAYNPGWTNPDYRKDFFDASNSIVAAAKQAGVKRVLVVGGAGSLWMNGAQLVDGPQFPEAYRSAAAAVRDYLEEMKKETELDWVFLSPAIEFGPTGPTERIGTYRTGLDEPVFDAENRSRISAADMAIAIVDEIETPKFHKQRFTVAY